MKTYPSSEGDWKEARKMGATPEMLEILKVNPEYVFWDLGDDYMKPADEKGWSSGVIIPNWHDFGWGLDELNELVNFYYSIERENIPCPACQGECYNPQTSEISRAFYDFEGTGARWCDNITQDEADELVKQGRLTELVGKNIWLDEETGKWIGWENGTKGEMPAPEFPTASAVNHWNRSKLGHDAINRSILIRTRAQRLGGWGWCETCKGDGIQYTEPEPHICLTLWYIHPRKGASRGVRIERVSLAEVPETFDYLREAARRNADRFAKLENFVYA